MRHIPSKMYFNEASYLECEEARGEQHEKDEYMCTTTLGDKKQGLEDQVT